MPQTIKNKLALYLEDCQQTIEKVKTHVWSIEDAAEHLTALLLQDDELLKHPGVQTVFQMLHEAEIPREVSYTQPIGNWDKAKADQKKEQEWDRVVDAVKRISFKI